MEREDENDYNKCKDSHKNNNPMVFPEQCAPIEYTATQKCPNWKMQIANKVNLDPRIDAFAHNRKTLPNSEVAYKRHASSGSTSASMVTSQYTVH